MKKFLLLLFVSVILSWGVTVSEERNSLATVPNFSFEAVSQENLPHNWTLPVSGTAELSSQAAADGKNSLKIHHPDWDQSEALSAPVELQIGHLYRISARVKTRDAKTDAAERYPTPVAGCITMESFPFTNHSPAVGGSSNWTKIEQLFIATRKTDRIRLHLGYNGSAIGTVWFDRISLEKVEDISEYIPPETVTWFGEAFRYDDRGWIFVHIEGEPYQRGYQYGYLVSEEIVAYLNKLAIEANEDNPKQGWNDTRFIADAFMLQKYDTEFLTEMKGIADGANKNGAKVFDRELDLLDVVTMNSVIDIEWARYAMRTTPHQLSGQNFLKKEDELNIPGRLHKCSGFLATKSSTTSGRIVFGQIFMWDGYTGPHWNVICDVVPAEGHRLVYQTFPGGIHSGADFYINQAGIMIGETTVSQTPFNPEGSPQSNRIRKAAQYANSIDDVVKILVTDNNGMYANDWLIGDTKTDEIAVLLLGTEKHKLWRSSRKEFYGDTQDFYWCNNNNKDPEVRKEYVPNAKNAPHDLIFTPWNRDLAFNEFYRAKKGEIDAITGVNLLATSPINLPHACDGKITTSEMAENLVFLAHSGKVTLREKFVGENRRIPDLPGAVPRLSLGYSAVSPVFVAKKLKALKPLEESPTPAVRKEKREAIIDSYNFNKRNLWFNTVYPASEAENWFVSGTAAYWRILNDLPGKDAKILDYMQSELAELNCRYLYNTLKEGLLSPLNTRRVYDQYKFYQIPRIKGTILLHQLRVLLGNDKFCTVMNTIHERYREKEMRTEDFIWTAEKIAEIPLRDFILQWLERDDLPEPNITASRQSVDNGWEVNLSVTQSGFSYHFLTSVKIVTDSTEIYQIIEISNPGETFTFTVNDKPHKILFNALNDVLLKSDNYFTWSNFFDDFNNTLIICGTRRQIEANHTLARRFSKVLADRYTEILTPVRKDSEINTEELKNFNLIILGSPEDNSLAAEVGSRPGLETGKNYFKYNEIPYGRSDDGIFLSFPSPYNSERAVYLFHANSASQLYQMTRAFLRMPSWAIFRGDRIVEKGYHLDNSWMIELGEMPE